MCFSFLLFFLECMLVHLNHQVGGQILGDWVFLVWEKKKRKRRRRRKRRSRRRRRRRRRE